MQLNNLVPGEIYNISVSAVSAAGIGPLTSELVARYELHGWRNAATMLPPLKGHGKIAGIKHMFDDFFWDWDFHFVVVHRFIITEWMAQGDLWNLKGDLFTKFGGRNLISMDDWRESRGWLGQVISDDLPWKHMVFFLLFSTTKWVGAGKLSIHESLLVALCTFLLMFLVLRYLVVESDEMMAWESGHFSPRRKFHDLVERCCSWFSQINGLGQSKLWSFETISRLFGQKRIEPETAEGGQNNNKKHKHKHLKPRMEKEHLSLVFFSEPNQDHFLVDAPPWTPSLAVFCLGIEVWSLVITGKITSPTQATYELIVRKRFVYDLCWGWVVPPINSDNEHHESPICFVDDTLSW